jgi:L-alanine-DL-glutamate epimerase-like enolase superfamily enzyme
LTIKDIAIYKLKIPLKQPFVISLGPINHAENIIVVVRTKEGTTGYGECSPYMTINGESIDTCFIVGQYLARTLIGQNALELSKCMEIMDRVIYANTSIKSAFDIALHDIAAQHAGLPLYQYLGGKKNKILQTDMTVSIGTPETACDALSTTGFSFYQSKIGRRFRNRCGKNKDNQGWNRSPDSIAY